MEIDDLVSDFEKMQERWAETDPRAAHLATLGCVPNPVEPATSIRWDRATYSEVRDAWAKYKAAVDLTDERTPRERLSAYFQKEGA